MLNIKEELAKLKDIHEPQDAIPIFPLAPIWYILIVIVIISIIALIIFLIYRKKTYLKRSAIQKLNNISSEINSNDTSELKAINRIAILIRKLALMKFKDEKLAAITDQKWLEFLDRNLEKQYFQSETGNLLISANYQKEIPKNADVQHLIDICKIWVNSNL